MAITEKDKEKVRALAQKVSQQSAKPQTTEQMAITNALAMAQKRGLTPTQTKAGTQAPAFGVPSARTGSRAGVGLSALSSARSFEEYARRRKEQEEADGMRAAAQKLSETYSPTSIASMGRKSGTTKTAAGLFTPAGNAMGGANRASNIDFITGKSEEREQREARQAAANNLAMQYGFKNVAGKAVYATPFSPLPDPNGERGASRAQAPGAYGIDPTEYAGAMQSINHYQNLKQPENDEETQAFLDRYFGGSVPTAEEFDETYQRLYSDFSVPDEDVSYFYHTGAELVGKAGNAQEAYAKEHADAQAAYDAAIRLLGEDAVEYANGSTADFLSRYYETFGSKQAAEVYARDYSVPGLFEDYDEHDATMQSILSRGKATEYAGTSLETGRTLLNRKMTDEQAGAYMMLANVYGENVAQQYYQSLLKEDGYNERAYRIREQALIDETNDNWLKASAKTFLSAPAQIAGGAYAIGQALRGEEIDPYDSAFVPAQWTQTPRAQTQQIITDTYGKVDEETGETKDTLKSWLLKAVYSAATSGVDSATSALLSGGVPGVGAALQGAWSVGGSVQDALARGGSDEQALWLGGINAIVETATEYLPMDSLVKAIDGRDIKTIKDVLVSAAKGAMSEAPGEALSELGNSMADSYIMGELSNWKQAVQEKGAVQAAKDLAFDVLTSGFVGALSGTGSNTMAATGNYIGNRAWQKELDAAAQQYDAEQQAKAEAEAPQATAPQQSVEQKPDVRDELVREYAPDPAQVEAQQADQSTGEQESTQKEKPAEEASEGNDGEMFQQAREATLYDEDGQSSNVRVLGVARADNGSIELRVENEHGEVETVNAGDVDYGDVHMNELMGYGALERMDAKGLRNYLEGYDAETATAEEYAEAYNAVYHRAKAGLDYDQTAMQNEAARQHLTEGARMSAYAAGQNAYNQTHDTGSAEIVSEIPETGASEASYSIKEENGQKYVDVDTDQDIFEGKTSAEYPRIVRDYIKNHFRGTVVGSESNKAYVDARTGQEYTNPANHRIEQNTFDSKMKAGTELDNLVSASTFAQHNEPDARHPEFPGGFDLYDVMFKVAGKTFRGRLNIGIDSRGRKRLYDLTQIKNLDNRVGVKQQENAAAPSGNQDRSTSVRSTGATTNGTSPRQSHSGFPVGTPDAESTVGNSSIAQKAANGKLSKQYSTKKWNTLTTAEKRNAIAQMEVLAALATRTGRTIVVKDSVTTEDGRKANARYIHKDGVIEVALDMEEGAYAYAAVHELVHALKREHGSAWPEFRDFVLNALAEAGENVDALVQQQMERHGYGREKAIEEVVCNTVPAVLQDERNILKLYKGSKTLFERVVEWAKAMLDDVKRAGEALVKRGKSWAQMDALASDRAALQGIYDRLMSVMESQREETNGADEEASYSMRDTDENVQEAMNALQKAFQQVRSHRITAAEADRLAGVVLKESNSTYDRQKLAAEISRTYDYIERGEDINWNQVDDELTSLMAKVMEKSRTLDMEHEEMAQPIRDYLKNNRISLTTLQQSEAANMGGTYNGYRKMLFGYVRLNNKIGTKLDGLWSDLSDMNSELFPRDASEGEQPRLLLEAVDALKPVYHNGTGMNVEESANWLAGKLNEAYFNLPAVKAAARDARTFGDSILDLKAAMKRFEESNTEEFRRALQSVEKAREKQERTEWQKKREAMRKKDAAKHAKKMAQSKERELKAKYRAKIERTTKAMANWLLNPTDAKHIPAGVEDSVKAMLAALDFSGKDTKVAATLTERLNWLALSIENAQKGSEENTEGAMYFELDQQMVDEIRRVAEMIQNNTDHQTQEGRGVYDLNGTELKELSKWLDVVRHVISNASKLRGTNLQSYGSVAEVQQMSYTEIRQKKAWKDKKWITKEWEKHFGADMLDSFTFFERLGPTANAVFKELRGGFDQMASHLREAEEFSKTLFEGLDMKKLTGERAPKHKVKLENGNTLEMTKGEIMAIYVLSNREQARGHMYAELNGEGIQLYSDEDPDPNQLTAKDEKNIVDMLTADEKRVAEGMQKFLSKECANWGNETSMKLLGYRKFGEEYYWPIRTDGRTRNSQKLEETFEANINAIQNQGMTKATIKGAKNAIVIEDIFDTYTKHISNMAAYSAYAMPLSDFNKWYNNTAIKRSIAKVMGPKGEEYIKNLLMAINGTARPQQKTGVEKLMSSMNRNAKTASVGLNARVVIQQPTSFARAAMYMSPKYLTEALVHKAPKAELINKYCGIAQWKDWGFYETNVGPNMKELLTGNMTGMAWLRDKSMVFAAMGDQWTMNRLWVACELETREIYPELAQGSEEYYQQVGKRMSEIIDRTQVVDSVFHRSQMMRSKNWMAQTLTNFMSEPTKTYNMLMGAIYDFADNRKNKAAQKRLSRAFGVWIVTGMLTGAAAAVVDAFRDEEDEKKWLEKWQSAFVSNTFIDNLNPLGMLPLVKDVWSLVQGYSNSNMALQSVQKLIWAYQAVEKAWNGEGTQNWYGVLYKIAQAASSLTGIPVSNVMRDFNGVWQTITGVSLTLKESGRKNQRVSLLYDAMLNGEKKEAENQRSILKTKAGLSDKEIDTALAERLVKDPQVKEAWEAKSVRDYATMNRAKNALTGKGFTGEMVDKAILRYGDSVTEEEEKEKDLDKQLNVALYSNDEVVMAVKTLAGLEKGGSVTEADVRAMLSDRAAGSEAQDPDKQVKSDAQSELKKDYLAMEAKGDTAGMKKLAAAMNNVLGTKQETMDGWVKDQHADNLRVAVDKYDSTAARKAVTVMRKDGKSDGDIKKSLDKYKQLYIDAMGRKDTATANKIKTLLKGLGLTGKNGDPLYTDKTFSDWLKK